MKGKLKYWISFFLILLIGVFLSGCSQRENKINELGDLNKSGRTIAFEETLAITDIVQKQLPDVTINYMNAVNSIQALKNNKIDAFVVDQMAAAKIIEVNPDIKILENANISTRKVAFALSDTCKIPNFVNKVNAFVEEKVADGTFNEIYDRWNKGGRHELPDAPKVENPKYTLCVGTVGTAKPFSYVQDNRLVGTEIEICNLLGPYLNAKVEYVAADWGALLAGVSVGKYDMVASNLFITDERLEGGTYSIPYITNDLKVLVKADGRARASFFSTLIDGFEKTFLREGRWGMILWGLGVTLTITIFGFLFANFVGGILCWMSFSQKKVLRIISSIYIGVIQGTPMVVVLLILFYIVFGKVRVSGVLISILACALVSGAYLAGIFRAGMETVDWGQVEAAAALGLTKLQIVFGIILPQAVRYSLSAYFAEFIGLMKGTAVVGYVAVVDLTKVSDIIRSTTFDAIIPLLSVALIYLALTWGLIGIMNMIKKQLERRHTIEDLKVVVKNDRN